LCAHLPPPPQLYPLSLHDALPIPMWKSSQPLDRLRRGGAPRLSNLRTGRLDLSIGGLTSVILLLGLLYGFCMGWFAVFNHEAPRSEEHTSELQSLTNLVCRLLLEN